ncbi:MMPL family transporter [Halorussus rarus]|uniref:MMPL family transporter n=2 Tax=Halorussus TaxID=1070314 RepID=UPI001F0775A3|nr:MMPL family transporter [Halorussus rarus]
MNASDLFAVITEHSRKVIVVLLVLTVLVGAGAPMVEQSSSLDQFQSDSTAAQKLDYIESNFDTGQQNTTTVQVIVRDRNGNVLSKGGLVETLELQQALRANGTIRASLANDTPTTGVANIVATVAIRQEQAAELRQSGAELQQRRQSLNESRAELQRQSRELNLTAARLSDALNQTRGLQARYDRLNASYQQGQVNNSSYRQRSAQIETELQQVRAAAIASLNENQSTTFVRAYEQVRGLQFRLDRLNASYQRGEVDQSTYRERATEIRSQFEQVYRLGTRGVLASQYQQLQQQGQQLRERGQQLRGDAEALQAQRQQLQNASAPSLEDQIEQLRSMNRSEVESTVETVLSEGGEGVASQAFAFMPTSYEPGSTEANATMLVVFQDLGSGGMGGMSSSDALVETQIAIQDLAHQSMDREVMVFGAGIISQETEQSMTDSIAIVGPLALLFVVLTLLVAYRDLLDIALGVFGIGAVLVWTFGFMGWADITFNQIFIAVPVLLIGLSIDYAIHVFMRHREEREEHDGESVREGMSVALASVGVALVWVTATTVIGFLSNLVSPLPPIQDFGIVSSVGIAAALVVFGGLIPALKVEIDGFLESRGWDRKKRAFGTSGGVLGSVLSVGAVAARRAPYVVLAVTLVLSAGGAYGATQVDTTFDQTDFLAEDPPAWTERLPGPMVPGDYSAKANLEFVNQNFLRQDSQAQILVEGDVATPQALRKLEAATETAAQKEDVVVVLSNGEPQIRSPLSVMESVAAQNETFNATFTAADTDGDGVPDRNVERVYDELFEVAPQEAAGVVNREDDEYAAARMVVSVKGGASSSTVTEEMRSIADGIAGDGLDATATGQPIVFEIVQDQLLDTVIESLLITLAATFAFLMLAYRLAHGSATLGAITLLPVAFSVSWILGTMYLLGMPFNVLTGMITSLTVGLGVAYSIHLSERYTMELGRRDTIWAAMRESVTGTGGALLGSAATTVGGFGVLAFAILPALQQFGIITGLTIIYAFLASVLVLPSMLVLWTRYLGPGETGEAATERGAAVANGGATED